MVDRSVVVVEPTLTLSEKSRAQALLRERGAAKAMLQGRYSLSQRGYVISADGLFGAAEWYGCVLKPQNAAQDTLRVILQKKNGGWVVAAKPAITIGAPSHPDIPFDVVRQVNEL